MSEAEGKMKGRLKEKSDAVLLEHLYRPRIEADIATMPYLTEANLAHVIMLYRQQIIAGSDARDLLGALLDIDRQGVDALELDEDLEGLYYNYEQHLIQELGSRVGGRLHTGRSRNDLKATMSRMEVRDRLLDLLEDTLTFRRALTERGRSETHTIITGYTHLQPAQPITLGHYLAAIAGALERDTERLLQTYHNTNQSPLGAGALAGTGFPIDRELTAELLGFAGLIENTLDAVGGRDYLLDYFANMANLAITLSRFTQDLLVWYTHEFAIISFPDRLGGTSSIMPQKKNPSILESSRGRLSHVLAGWTSAAAAMKNTNYTNVGDVNTSAFGLLEKSTQELTAALDLLRAAVEGMEVNEEHSLRMAAANFSTVTQLADTLVLTGDFSFREAHHLVGAVVHRATEKNMKATDITAEFIDQIALAETGQKIGLAEEAVEAALDPRYNVEARAHRGGPAPEAAENSLKRLDRGIASHSEKVASLRKRIASAKKSLRATARQIADREAE